MMKSIVILFGGPGGEHEVSLRSARNVIDNIDKNKYNVVEVYVDKKAIWYLGKLRMKEIEILKKFPIESTLFWPIFHGPYGEGGTVQKILEKAKVNFVGSGSVSSNLAMDKLKTQKILQKHKLNVPNTFVIKKNTEFNVNKIKKYPAILKPVDSGSSVDLYKCNDQKGLTKALVKIKKHTSNFLLQEFISGREFTCGVINIKSKIIPLLPTEIILKNSEMFDYNTKYTAGACEDITPANINPKTTKEIQRLAIKAHKILDCRDISRTDMIMDDNGKITILETNTIPGMTKTSFIPAQLKASGISFDKFVDILYNNHLK